MAESWIYITKDDRALPKDQQSRFTLSPMTYAERDATRDAMNAGDGVYQRGRKIALEHIVSVENFPVGDPKPWPTNQDDREAYLAMLDDSDVLEIGNEVWARSTLGPDEEALKNSSTPERTSASGVSSPESISTTAPPAVSAV